jgi:hypothetical protein
MLQGLDAHPLEPFALNSSINRAHNLVETVTSRDKLEIQNGEVTVSNDMTLGWFDSRQLQISECINSPGNSPFVNG